MHWELVEQAVEEHAQIIPIPLNRTSQFIPVGRRACPGSILIPGIHISRSHLILFRSYIHVFLSFFLSITFFRSLDTPDSYPVFTPPCSDHVYFENRYSSFSFDYLLFHSFYFSIHGSFHHWNIIDFSSTAGTYLNRERLVPWVSYPLHCGDLLGVGDFLNLFRI